MRSLLLVLLCACGQLNESLAPWPEVEATDVRAGQIVFALSWGVMAFDTATGDCRRHGDHGSHDFPKRPRPPIGSLDDAGHLRTVRVGSATYLERRDARGTRSVLLPEHARLEWIEGTDLVLIDRTLLFHAGTGRRLRVPGDDDDVGFTLLDRRLVVVEMSALAVYDLELAAVARTSPKLPLYSVGTDPVLLDVATRTTADSLTHSFRLFDRVPVAAEWTEPPVLDDGWHEIDKGVFAHKTATHLELADRPSGTMVANLELPGTAAWIVGSPVVIGESWLYQIHHRTVIPRPPGRLEVSVAPASGYIRDEHGEIFVANHQRLSPAVWDLGRIVHASALGVVLAREASWVFWHYRPDGTWRLYWYGICR